MKVILLKELKGKGKPGDVVEVAGGFANNYLLPQGHALRCTAANLVELRKRRSADDEKGSGRGAPALKVVAETRLGIRFESPAFADGDQLRRWVADSLGDSGRWRWFGEEGDTLRVVAAEGDVPGVSESARGHLAKRESRAVTHGSGTAGCSPRRRGPERARRNLRIAGRACARLARSFR